MSRLRPQLTYANVVSTICLVLIVGGGGAFAASQLAKNSVGSKQLKKNAVTTAKIKNEAVIGAKVKKGTLTGTQINASTLGTVPTANTAGTAGTASTANALAPPEAFHLVGATGEPAFQNSWHNFAQVPGNPVTVGFYKDQEGVVHLKGRAEGGTAETIFQLPPGYRPASGRILGFAVICTGCNEGKTNTGDLGITGSDGAVQAPAEATRVGLDGVTFRAES
jgi:hypothetical protein